MGIVGVGTVANPASDSLLTCVSVARAAGTACAVDFAAPWSQWITVNEDYSSQRYVNLDQITPENVGALQKICELETFTAAPIAWDGKVFIGIGTSDYGIRGRLAAFDAPGKELWRFHTIPYLGQRGASTWPTWPFGPWPRGGGFWTSFSLDPATGEVFGPVANPDPDCKRDTWGRANLFTNSVISLNDASGRPNWFYQTIAGDTHDWDLGTAPTLYRTKSGREMLAITGKEGFVFGLDRANSVSNPNAMGEKQCVFSVTLEKRDTTHV